MFPLIENINPCKSWLSITDFDDALLDLHTLLKQAEATFCEEDKQKILEKAFKLASACLHATKKGNPNKHLALIFAEILRQYAALCCEENVYIAKQIFLASLGCHLYGIDCFSTCIDMHDFASLKDLKSAAASQPLLFSNLESSILSMPGDTCLIQAYKSSFIQQDSQKNLFCLAEALRGLGHSYQCLHEGSLSIPAPSPFFRPLLQLSESLLLLAQNDESRRALADLYVQARHYLHSQPQTLEEIEHFYDICLSYDSSEGMQVRVAHQYFLILSQHGYRKEALPYIHQALNTIAGISLEHEKQLSLLANLCNDYALYLMNPHTPDLKLAEQLLETSVNYANRSRAAGRDLFIFARYDISSAQLYLLKGDLQTARNLIERALATLHKYPFHHEDLLIQAEALKSLIHQTTFE